MISASAPGKLVLLGEYAVLRGAPALVAAVERRARVECEPRAAGFLVRAPQLGVEAELELDATGGTRAAGGDALAPSVAAQLGVVLATLASAQGWASEHGAALPPSALTLDTAAFFRGADKLGLGSSAAVAVASWAALVASADLELPSPLEIFALASQAHRAAQGGRGSGIDVAASVYGGVLDFSRGQEPRTVALPAGVELVAVWTGSSASTPDLVGQVEGAVDRDPKAAAALAALVEEAQGARAVLEAGDASAFLDGVRRYHRALAALGEATGAGIVTAPHAALAAAVEAAGGAYKPSGAGGGDLGVAFTRGPTKAVAAAIAAAGFEVIPLALARRGLEVLEVLSDE